MGPAVNTLAKFQLPLALALVLLVALDQYLGLSLAPMLVSAALAGAGVLGVPRPSEAAARMAEALREASPGEGLMPPDVPDDSEQPLL